MTTRSRPFSRVICASFALAVVCLLICCRSDAQEGGLSGGPDAKVLQELKFAEALNGLGMADYAQIILGKLPNTPEVAVLKKRLLIDSFIFTGKFDDVKAIIAKEADQESEAAWAMKLALADGLYAWGKYNEAQVIYLGFFNKYPKGPPAGLNNFFMDSAYKFAQMLLLMGEKKMALEAYKNVLKANVPKHVERQIWSETAELMLQVAEQTQDKAARETMFKEIQELCNKILWVQDLWFGKAIVYMAHIKMLTGDSDGATKLIDEYRANLVAIDEALKESSTEDEDMTKLSPMAQCRYLIAVIMQDEAMAQIKAGNKNKALELLLGKQTGKERTQGAFQHFMNVFARYPNTSWAPDAGERADIIKALAIKDLGVKEINVAITPEMWEKVKKAQFQEARSLFNRQLFKEAAEAYAKVLNRFPLGDTAISAISELARCYIELEDIPYAQMAERYLAECFGRKDQEQALAGDKLLGIAQMYEERKLQDERDEIYDLFFKYFIKHSRASVMLFQFGEDKLASQDYSGALGYYGKIAQYHKDSNLFAISLFKMSLCYGALGQKAEEVKTLIRLAEHLEARGRPDLLILNARFGIAQAYRQIGMEMMAKREDAKAEETANKYLSVAASKYHEMIGILSGTTGEAYRKSKDMEEPADAVLEGAMFYKGYTYTMLTMPADKVNNFKALALQGYQELVKSFPKSKFAPQALSQIGTLYTMFGKADEAELALRQLQKDYADSPEAQNVDFTLGMNLLKLGRRREATVAFKKMFDGKGQYSAQKIMMAGNELFLAKEYDIALEAYDKALTMSQERNIVEPSKLGKGKIWTEKGMFKEAVDVLDGVLKDYPGSGYTPETGFYLSRAASEFGMREPDEDKRFDMFNKAMSALKLVRRHTGQDSGKKAETDVEIGRINELKAQSEKEFGAPENVERYRDDAIAAYQVLMMFADPRDAAVRPHLEKAFQRCMPLLFDGEKWEDVIVDADKYLKMFPSGEYASEIRTWRNKAVVKHRMEGGAIPSEAGGVDEEKAPAGAGANVQDGAQVNQEEI